MAERLSRNSEENYYLKNTKDLGRMSKLAEETDERKEVKEARENVKYWAEQYANTESDFIKNGFKNEVEFEIYENDASEAFSKMKRAEYESDFYDTYEKDRYEKISYADPAKTIEARSGYYYDERNSAILAEIKKNPNEEERKADEAVVEKLQSLVAAHIEACRDYDVKQRSAEEYDRKRREAHNAMISGLNKINHIAEKYHVKRLVFRDFEVSIFHYDEKRDIQGESKARREYDRSCVEAYVRQAFKDGYEKAEKEDNITDSNSVVARFHTND